MQAAVAGSQAAFQMACTLSVALHCRIRQLQGGEIASILSPPLRPPALLPPSFRLAPAHAA